MEYRVGYRSELIWPTGQHYLRDTANLEDVTQEVFVEL